MSVQSFDNLSLLLQIQAATRGLGKSMYDNANSHIAWAQAQSVALLDTTNPDGSAKPGLITIVNACAASYLRIIATATTFVQNNSAQVAASVALIGATLADLSNYTAPLKTAAQNLQAADKSTYDAITSACNALLAAVPGPASIFGT